LGSLTCPETEQLNVCPLISAAVVAPIMAITITVPCAPVRIATVVIPTSTWFAVVALAPLSQRSVVDVVRAVVVIVARRDPVEGLRHVGTTDEEFE
jgi:hypothetical protein